jgi:hypothetical protein
MAFIQAMMSNSVMKETDAKDLVARIGGYVTGTRPILQELTDRELVYSCYFSSDEPYNQLISHANSEMGFAGIQLLTIKHPVRFVI